MKLSIKNEAQVALSQVKRQIEEYVGKNCKNVGMEAKVKIKRIAGKAQKNVGGGFDHREIASRWGIGI